MANIETRIINWQRALNLEKEGKIHFTPRERQYIELRARGNTYTQSLRLMGISRRSLWRHQRNCHNKYFLFYVYLHEDPEGIEENV